MIEKQLRRREDLFWLNFKFKSIGDEEGGKEEEEEIKEVWEAHDGFHYDNRRVKISHDRIKNSYWKRRESQGEQPELHFQVLRKRGKATSSSDYKLTNVL